jgi:hypothetical protein
MVPMNLWYAGIVLSMLMRLIGDEHAKRTAARLMNQMPIIIALGVNFGIIPLLFTQVAYYRAFYPATILMAWPWFGIFVLLTLAYYGVYVYVIALRRDPIRVGLLKGAVGWAAAILFIVMGFIFANSMSLMTNVGAWPELWKSTGVAGAPMGTALNTGDPSLWPRWLMMFGLALTTTGAYIAVDAGFFAGGESEDYRRRATGLALAIYTVGVVWFAVTGSWYVFGTWPMETRRMMLDMPLAILTALTALGPGLPWLLIALSRRGLKKPLALTIGIAQFGVLALNAISRQILQNIELGRFMDATAEKVNMQWSPLVLFLLFFVVGLGVIVWMLSRVVASERKAAAPGR